MEIAQRVGPSFLLNVTLNDRRRITGVFAGDLAIAHRAGRRACASRPCNRWRPRSRSWSRPTRATRWTRICIKGSRACRQRPGTSAPAGRSFWRRSVPDGIPSGSPYDLLLREETSIEGVLARLATPGFSRPEQVAGPTSGSGPEQGAGAGAQPPARGAPEGGPLGTLPRHRGRRARSPAPVRSRGSRCGDAPRAADHPLPAPHRRDSASSSCFEPLGGPVKAARCGFISRPPHGCGLTMGGPLAYRGGPVMVVDR
jgi:hypothetical protein